MCRCSSALGRLRTKSPNGDSGVEAAAVIASLGKLFGKDMFERAFYIALQGFTCKTRIALFLGVDHVGVVRYRDFLLGSCRSRTQVVIEHRSSSKPKSFDDLSSEYRRVGQELVCSCRSRW